LLGCSFFGKETKPCLGWLPWSAAGSLVPAERIERAIFLIRGHKVMLDADLATLYGVQTKALVQAVKRNLRRFPQDFMFQLSWDEARSLSRFGKEVRRPVSGRVRRSSKAHGATASKEESADRVSSLRARGVTVRKEPASGAL
jgi:hypothetical protein